MIAPVFMAGAAVTVGVLVAATTTLALSIEGTRKLLSKNADAGSAPGADPS